MIAESIARVVGTSVDDTEKFLGNLGRESLAKGPKGLKGRKGQLINAVTKVPGVPYVP